MLGKVKKIKECETDDCGVEKMGCEGCAYSKKVVLYKEEVEKEVEGCREYIRYWEERYRNCEDEFNKKSFKRQINLWQGRFEVWRFILNMFK